MVRQGYDVAIVGTRAAGAATAMLLARHGLSVLAVDRVRFPSDTLSTHQVQLPGVARLSRWGLLDALDAAGTPAVAQVTVDLGHTVLTGRFPSIDGADSLYSPRRTVLDTILVEAARRAGAEVREDYLVEELEFQEGRVVGIAGRPRHGARTVDLAGLVIGADGKNSLVARSVNAQRYHEQPVATFASYSYWSGVAVTGGAMYHRPGRAAAVFPTNDGLTMVLAIAPAAEFARRRGDLAAHYLDTLGVFGDLGERVRAGRQEERLRSTPDLPHAFRVPHGPGWALVGDAGLVLDPITAQGISNALRDAELLADQVAANVRAGRPLGDNLAAYQQRRDAAARPMFDLTTSLARLAPSGRLNRRLMTAVAARPAETRRFLGVFAGAVPVREFFALHRVLRLLAARTATGGVG